MNQGFSQTVAKRFFSGENKGKWLIAAAIAVVVLILLSDTFFRSDTVTETVDTADYVEKLEEKLESVLRETKGVGECEVVITAVGGSEYVYATEKTDKSKYSVSQDKSQTDTDIKTNLKTVTEQNAEKPLVEREVYPEILGAVIVCSGGGSVKVRAEVSEIASTLLGISADKIVVGEKR